jgi:hypothetical protein
MASAWQPPSSAQSLPFRPLDKGVILDRPGQVVPDGGFSKLENFIANKEGPKRRPGFAQYAGGDTVPYPMVDYITLWKTDGGQVSLLLTEKTLWRVNPISGFTEVEWIKDDTNTITVAAGAITGSGTTWASADIRIGDLIRTADGEARIVSINSDTLLQVDQSTLVNGAGQTYAIQGTFSPGEIELPDWTIFNDFLLIADGKHPLLKYDAVAETISYWVDAPAKEFGGEEFIPGCVSGFLDRVWCGWVKTGTDGNKRQRILWSGLADPTDFNFPTNYLDLPYVNGALRRLVPLADQLAAYFDDAVFLGTQTNYPLLPLRFDRVETGGIGIVGSKAVIPYLGGHFWIGQDDMYLLTQQGPQRIGSPIVKQSIKTCQVPSRCYVAADPWNFNIVFGFPVLDRFMERLWRYDYRSKSWSMDGITTYMIANPVVNTSIEWDDLTGIWDNLGDDFPSWDSIKLEDPRKFLFLEQNGSIWKQTEYGDLDFTTDSIAAILETKDHDFDDPDGVKTITRFGIKLEWDVPPTVAVTFAAAVSVNRGITWKPVGNLIVGTGRDEGYVNFRATGSTFRIRLTTTTRVTSYYVAEYTIRACGGGEELDVSTQG